MGGSPDWRCKWCPGDTPFPRVRPTQALCGPVLSLSGSLEGPQRSHAHVEVFSSQSLISLPKRKHQRLPEQSSDAHRLHSSGAHDVAMSGAETQGHFRNYLWVVTPISPDILVNLWLIP